MSQRAFLAELDAELHEALAEESMADSGTYTSPAPGAVAVPARVYVDKRRVLEGDFSRSVHRSVLLTILREDVSTPEVNGIVVVDGETFRLESPADEDDGITIWVASYV